jgi:hypothetical protein
MKNQKQLDGLNYKQFQKRNSDKFNSLSQNSKKLARQEGYKNIGWENICQSWNILQRVTIFLPVDFIEFTINKAEKRYKQAKQKGDLLEILESGKKVIQSIKIKYQ